MRSPGSFFHVTTTLLFVGRQQCKPSKGTNLMGSRPHFLPNASTLPQAFQKPVCIPLLLLATAHSEVCRRERGPPGPDTEYYKEQTILAAQWVARHAAVAW
eukprot:EG_transcript_48325